MYNSIFDRVWASFHSNNNVVPIPTTPIVVAKNPATTNILQLVPKMLQDVHPQMTLALATDVCDAINAHSSNYNFTTEILPMFCSQTMEESSFYSVLEENLYYSTPGRLMAVWPSRFPNLASELPYLKNPEKLANYVYANRLGNGDAASNDGWNYRGRGAIQITGKANYTQVAKYFNMGITETATYMSTIEGAIESAMYFWNLHNLGKYTTADDVDTVTKIINGSLTGLEVRQTLFTEVSNAIN